MEHVYLPNSEESSKRISKTRKTYPGINTNSATFTFVENQLA